MANISTGNKRTGYPILSLKTIIIHYHKTIIYTYHNTLSHITIIYIYHNTLSHILSYILL